MAEEMDKQEPATPYKLDEARKKGQVGRSRELTSYIMLLTLVAGFIGVLPSVARLVVEHTSWWIENAAYLASDGLVLQYHADRILRSLVSTYFAPVIAAAVVATVVASIVHAGFVLSLSPLKPDFSRISPSAGLKRVFSSRSLVEAAKLVVKVAVMTSVFILLWPSLTNDLSGMLDVAPAETARRWLAQSRRISQAFLTAFAVFAIFDLWFSKRDFARQMRMSRRDLKDEYKRREGDPAIKSRRRHSQLELLKHVSALAKVKDSDVIVTNPTHVAVALRYRPKEGPLPTTVAMGRGYMAKAVLAIARKHRIPIIRQPALARALLRRGSPGAAIWHKRQREVAAIYRWVISLPGNRVLS